MANLNFSLRLGDGTTNQQMLNVVTLKDPQVFPVTATVSSGGTVTIDPPSIRVNELPDRGVWTIRIIFSELTAWTGYTYSVLQDGESIGGSFYTLPNNQSTPFSFIIGTCDNVHPVNPTNTFRTIRRMVETTAIPILHMFIIDDVYYVDEEKINDLATGLVSIGKPQDTGLGSDYAKAWVSSYGLLQSEPKWMLPDRQWVYRNLPCCYSGGDHAIAGNWCRGNPAPAAGDKQKKSCIRGPGSLEEIAGAEWDAFYGNINPQPLRAGQWYWGKDMGPIRLSLWDIEKTCEPYDSSVHTDTQCYGAQQLSDLTAFLDVDTHPFKIALMETGLTRIGQSWLEQHPTEAQTWLKSFKIRPNLNGNGGSFVAIYGDNHTVHTLKLNDFWAWSAGTLGDASAVRFPDAQLGWGGSVEYKDAADQVTSDRFLHNFILVTVRPDQSPAYLEISHIDGGTGEVRHAARLDYQAFKNQMVAL